MMTKGDAFVAPADVNNTYNTQPYITDIKKENICRLVKFTDHDIYDSLNQDLN